MAKRILFVSYTCPHEVGEAFVREMKTSGVYAKVLAEDGCEKYAYLFPAEGDGFCLVEQWRDEQALAKHAAGEAMAALKKIKAAYPMETSIERFEAQTL